VVKKNSRIGVGGFDSPTNMQIEGIGRFEHRRRRGGEGLVFKK